MFWIFGYFWQEVDPERSHQELQELLVDNNKPIMKSVSLFSRLCPDSRPQELEGHFGLCVYLKTAERR